MEKVLGYATSGVYRVAGGGLEAVVKRLGGVWDYAHSAGFIPLTFAETCELVGKFSPVAGGHLIEVSFCGLFIRPIRMKQTKWEVLSSRLVQWCESKKERG